MKELRFTLRHSEAARAPANASARKRPRSLSSGDEVESARTVSVRLVEFIDEIQEAEDDVDKHFGLFVWPCALVLAHYLASQYSQLVSNCTVLELGCGIALPGILCAMGGEAKRVILSDRADSDTIKRNVEANIHLNGVAHIASYKPLNWGSLDLVDHVERLSTVDIILAADCFYKSEDFEKVLVTVALVFRLNPRALFLATYQLRSINRTIAPLLLRYGMIARSIPTTDFLPMDEDVAGADSVYLYEIKPIQYVERKG